MSEVATGKITINDISVDIMKAMVKFIYSGKVEEERGMEFYEELLKASDQYLLAGLKEMCQLRLMAEVSVDNAIQMMQLGHMCKAEDLKLKAKKAIISKGCIFYFEVKNFVSCLMCLGHQIIQLEDWKENLEGFPDLIFEIMESLLAMQKGN